MGVLLGGPRPHLPAPSSHRDEANDSSTVFRCYLSLGTLHLQENHPALALRCYQQAVGVARKEGSGLNESEALQKLAVVCMCVCECV